MTIAGTKRRRLVPILQTVGAGLMAGVLAVIVLIGVAAIVVPAATGSTALTVLTSSMEPDLPAGTLVVVRPTPADRIAPGDIMTYQLRSGEPTLVTHRVTEQHRRADGGFLFVTKGDANDSVDAGFVQEVQVRGIVWYAIPWVGWMSQAVTGEVRAVVIPLIVAGLMAYALWMFIAGFLEKRRKPPQPGSGEDALENSGSGVPGRRFRRGRRSRGRAKAGRRTLRRFGLHG